MSCETVSCEEICVILLSVGVVGVSENRKTAIIFQKNRKTAGKPSQDSVETISYFSTLCMLLGSVLQTTASLSFS